MREEGERMSQTETNPQPPPANPPTTRADDVRQQRRNRGLRAASPPAGASPVGTNGAQLPGEIASIINSIEAENRAAGLGKVEGPMPAGAGPSPDQPRRTTRLVEIKHDYEAAGPHTFTSLRGVVLRLQPFSNELALKIQQNMLPDRPHPPSTWNEADQKNYVDENDEGYREALGAYITKASDVAFNVRISLGTEVHPSHPLPEGVFALDDDGWIEKVSNPALYGEYAPKIRAEGVGRYLDWLQFYVLGEGDIRHLYLALDHESGIVREVAVVEAVESFRDQN